MDALRKESVARERRMKLLEEEVRLVIRVRPNQCGMRDIVFTMLLRDVRIVLLQDAARAVVSLIVLAESRLCRLCSNLCLSSRIPTEEAQ